MATANISPSVAPLIAAYEQTTSSSATRPQKAEALQWLENFQKSPNSWPTLFETLQSDGANVPVRLFSSTALKGKMINDLHQLPRETLPSLRQSIFDLLSKYQNGPKPIRTQLSVCLAHLAIQMLEWKDVLPLVITTFSGKGPGATACFLEFLKVLSEEITEGRKINLSEDELIERSAELMDNNAPQVLQILSDYSQSSATASADPMLISCIQSWIKDIPLDKILDSPLFSAIFTALDSTDAFDSAIDCLIAMVRETKDVDDSVDSIRRLLPHILHLQPKIKKAADEENAEVLKGIAKLLSEAGEAWVVLIAREPQPLKPLVESILEVCVRDWEKEAIGYTFRFWYDLKLWLVLDRFSDARELYLPILSELVDEMIRHLQFPKPEGGDETDLFEGDRDQEERFRNYRHDMGNVLKDCCDVLGPIECLTKAYNLIRAWQTNFGIGATTSHFPNWQELEAAIFALRALAQVIPSDEDVMLPQLIPLLLQLPQQEKVRYQVIMTLGRYTEWTAQHPATLQLQLECMIAAFNDPSKEVQRGATHSFQFFCSDCASLLKDYFDQINGLYGRLVKTLPPAAAEDITEGMASILANQSLDTLYEKMKKCGDPIFENIIQLGRSADEQVAQEQISDNLRLLKRLIQKVAPPVSDEQSHPAVRYCQEILPALADIAQRYHDNVAILEGVCGCWRAMILSYRAAISPILGDIANKLVAGFAATKQGSFLWVSDAIVREFSEHSEEVEPSISQSVVPFFEQQAATYLQTLNAISANELPNLIEDFSRLTIDMLQHHTSGIVKSHLMGDIFASACLTLDLLKYEVLSITLHLIRDFIAYGTPNPPISRLSGDAIPNDGNEIQEIIKRLLQVHGEVLIQKVLEGMMYTFPEDCIPDASGVVLDMLRVVPQQTGEWISKTLIQLPSGAIRPQEREKLLGQIQQRVQANEPSKIRAVLQNFTSSYRRRNVAPREALMTKSV